MSKSKKFAHSRHSRTFNVKIQKNLPIPAIPAPSKSTRNRRKSGSRYDLTHVYHEPVSDSGYTLTDFQSAYIFGEKPACTMTVQDYDRGQPAENNISPANTLST
eukprot:4445495-Ditylum_brightwellii.AAC.1